MLTETESSQLDRERYVTAADVATLETCRTCPFEDTCLRHAPNTCNRYDGHRVQRARVNALTRRMYLDKEEIQLLAVIELGFMPYIGTRRLKSEVKQ